MERVPQLFADDLAAGFRFQGEAKTLTTDMFAQFAAMTGAPEIGHPIGVGFSAFRDTSVDDTTLNFEDANTQVLVLEINTTNSSGVSRVGRWLQWSMSWISAR